MGSTSEHCVKERTAPLLLKERRRDLENITLGDISLAAAFLASLIGSTGYLLSKFKKWMKNEFNEQVKSISEDVENQFKTVNKDVAEIKKKLDDVDRESTKNFLVQQLAEIEKGNKWDSIEAERFWEQYGHYVQNGGNTYIKTKVEKLQREGKI